MDRPVVRDVALVIVRLILGIIFVAHGWDKIFITGVDKTTGYFVAANIPQAHLTVWVVAIIEMIGGALLILGLLAPTVAVILMIEMIGAWWSMHLENGLFVRDNGGELVFALLACLVIIFVFGSGRFSLDRQFSH